MDKYQSRFFNSVIPTISNLSALSTFSAISQIIADIKYCNNNYCLSLYNSQI